MPVHRPIRILQMIARLNIGGPALYAVSLATDLPKCRYESLLISGRPGPEEGDMSYLAHDKGARSCVLPALGREISLRMDLESFLSLRKAIKRFGPDIIHTHTAKAGTLGRMAGMSINIFRSRNRRIRFVHTYHGHVFYGYFHPLKAALFMFIERALARFTHRIIAISPSQKDDICRRFRIADCERVDMIPLGFDLSDFKTSPASGREMRRQWFPSISEDTLLVGIIGRLTPVKNHRMFLDAVRHLEDSGCGNGFRFLIVGDGELRTALMNYAEALGIRESVLFTGWRRDMPAIYGAIDVAVLTSLNEGTPVTLIEAMASGKAVVATDVGGVRDLMGGVQRKAANGRELMQHGILIPSGKSELLAGSLLVLLEDREALSRMGRDAKAFVRQQYSLERLAKDITSLYSGLMTSSVG